MIRLIEGGAYIRLEGSKEEIDDLQNALKYKNPRYWYAPSYQLWLRTRNKVNPQGWDGFMRPIKKVGSHRVIPRGWREEVINAAEVAGLELDKSGLFKSPFDEIEPEDIPDDIVQADFELDDNQKRCICEWLRSAIGINKVTVSGGKLVTFCAAFAMIKRAYPDFRAIYFTPTERLLKQVVRESRAFLPEMDIGQFGGGQHEKDAKDMVVATTAMLGRNFNQLQPKGWFASFKVILADESQAFASPTLSKIATQIPAIFRLGASDTVKEDDIMANKLIMGLLGPPLHEVKAEGLIKAGRIAKPSIYLIDVPEWQDQMSDLTHEAPIGSRAYCLIKGEWVRGKYDGPVYVLDREGEPKLDKKKNPIKKINLHSIKFGDEVKQMESRWCLLDRLYDRAIIRFKARNEMIGMWAKYFTETHGQTLIICTRTTHVYILESVLANYVDPENVGILFSKHSSKQRDDAFEWFKGNPKAVLITPLVKVGVSINEIRAGIVADRVADWEYFNQLLGRMIRQKKTGANEAHIATFVDRQSPKYRLGSGRIFQQLKTVGGYTFFHPVTTPDTIPNAIKYVAKKKR